MPRSRRVKISPEAGSTHIISRVTDRTVWFSDLEKDYFLKLIERLSKGFYVEIHAFCIMSNHFHILATERSDLAEQASEQELNGRYQLSFGKDAEAPMGSLLTTGEIVIDDDWGLERLRRRLGSMSRFVQELKQSFTRWYNKQHSRKGFLWSDRYKGVLVAQGEAQLACAAYIDLNPIRANLDEVTVPDDYRFSSMGMYARAKHRYASIITPLPILTDASHDYAWYQEYVYHTGAVQDPNKQGHIQRDDYDDLKERCGNLGLSSRLRYSCLNFSEGIAIGHKGFIANLQSLLQRKFVKPRQLFEKPPDAPPDSGIFTTRVLKA